MCWSLSSHLKKKNETKKIYNTLFLCKGQDKNTTWKVVKTILEN
jgi:hypothetical protein